MFCYCIRRLFLKFGCKFWQLANRMRVYGIMGSNTLVSKLVLMGRMDSFWFEPRRFVVNKIRFNIDDTITEEVVTGRRI